MKYVPNMFYFKLWESDYWIHASSKWNQYFKEMSFFFLLFHYLWQTRVGTSLNIQHWVNGWRRYECIGFQLCYKKEWNLVISYNTAEHCTESNKPEADKYRIFFANWFYKSCSPWNRRWNNVPMARGGEEAVKRQLMATSSSVVVCCAVRWRQLSTKYCIFQNSFVKEFWVFSE